MRPALKKETFFHLIVFFGLFILITLIKKYFDLSYWPFWVGGLIGTFLPDIDHLIYVYFIAPQELTSQRVTQAVGKRKFTETAGLLVDTKNEREQLVFHNILFQLIFITASVLVLTSSGSIFGRGLVIAFNLHLLIDQFIDLNEGLSLSRWYKNLPFSFEKPVFRAYMFVVLLVILFFGFLL